MENKKRKIANMFHDTLVAFAERRIIIMNKCATCRFCNQDGYCQLHEKKVNTSGCCQDYEED